jgi:hypothetical protein
MVRRCMLWPARDSDNGRVAALELSSAYAQSAFLCDADWTGTADSLEIRVPSMNTAFFNAMTALIVVDTPATPPVRFAFGTDALLHTAT